MVVTQQAEADVIQREQEEAIAAERKAMENAKAAAQVAKDLHAKRLAASKAKTRRAQNPRGSAKSRVQKSLSAISARSRSGSGSGSGSGGSANFSVSLDDEDGAEQMPPQPVVHQSVQPGQPAMVQQAVGDAPRRLSDEFANAIEVSGEQGDEHMMPEMSQLTGISTESLPEIQMGEAKRASLGAQEDLAANKALDAAIAKAEAAAAASEKAAQNSVAGHLQAELAAAWIKAELGE